MPTPYADLQNLNQSSGFVELFTLDCSAIGGTVYRFTNHPNPDGGPLVFGGQSFAPLPIQASGFDLTTGDTPAKPTLTVSNVSKTLLSEVVALGDLVGTKVTRVRTYAKFLDAATFTRRNLFIWSEDLTRWTLNSADILTGTTTTGPFGTGVAQFVKSPGQRYLSIAVTAGQQYTFSLFVKPVNSTQQFRLYKDGVGGIGYGDFNALAGTSTSYGVFSAPQIVDVGGGWFRISATVTPSATGSGAFHVYPLSTTPMPVFGAQLELGTTATPYQYTTTTHQPFADSTKLVGPEVYVIEQKTGHNSQFIQWQLTSIIDRFGMKLPRRQVLKDKGFPGVSRVRV